MRLLIIIAFVFALSICAGSPAASEDHSVYRTPAECIGCHERTSPSHLLKSPQISPPDLPLDSNGGMTCLTCHDCISGRCILRKASGDLCRSCHDCKRGMSCLLGIVHMGNSEDIEQLSAYDCLGCHNGYVSTAANEAGDHKIDVLYITNKKFRSTAGRAVVLVNGRVKCISCHNPYETGNSKLVTSNTQSNLCITCHRK